MYRKKVRKLMLKKWIGNKKRNDDTMVMERKRKKEKVRISQINFFKYLQLHCEVLIIDVKYTVGFFVSSLYKNQYLGEWKKVFYRNTVEK